MRKSYDERNIYNKTQMRQLLSNWKQYIKIVESKGEQSLKDAYTYPSLKKQDAWNYCIRLKVNCSGFKLSVISANTNKFTAGFQFYDDSKLCFFYITKEHDWCIKVDDLINFDKLLMEEHKNA